MMFVCGIELKSMPFALEADFHSSSEKYFLVKSAQLWRNENHEYVYIAAVSDLNQENFIKYKDTVLCEGLTRVKPHKSICTRISVGACCGQH
jgi:hypothetical protein